MRNIVEILGAKCIVVPRRLIPLPFLTIKLVEECVVDNM